MFALPLLKITYAASYQQTGSIAPIRRLSPIRLELAVTDHPTVGAKIHVGS